MALPELRVPTLVPAFLLAGHQQMPGDVFATVEMGSGHTRKRRLFTAAPRIVRVGWILESDGMQAVHRWFERSLQVGTLKFAARVAGIGGIGADSAWYEAQWLEPYEAEPLHLGRWRVTGSLILTGPAYSQGPELTGFESEILVDLNVRISLDVAPMFESEVIVRLDPSMLFRSEVEVDLLAVIGS